MYSDLVKLYAVIALSLLLVGGCSHGDGAAPPTPYASVAASAAAPTATAPERRPGDNVRVTWVPAEAPLFTGDEPAYPFADTRPDINTARLEWQLYSAAVGDPRQRLLYDTHRQLLAPQWSADGARVSVRYGSKATAAPNGPNIVAGLLSFDPSDWSAPLADISVQAGGLLASQASWSPDGRKAVLTRATSFPTPGTIQPGEGYSPPTETVLVDVLTRSALKLQGVNANASPLSDGGWSPDGRFLVMYLAQPGNRPTAAIPSGDFYLVPTTNGSARRITSGTFLYPAWSPGPPYTVAFVSESGSLRLLDPVSGVVRSATPDSTFSATQRLIWWPDGRHIQAANRVVDVTTGKLVTYPPVFPYASVFAISPDGRYMLTADDPASDWKGVCPSISPPENHVYLYDRTVDQTSVIKDCDGRFFGLFDWLADSRHAVMRQFPCAACDGFGLSLVLKDIDSGRETPLTSGFEFGAWPVLSPDGGKVLVTGDRLRVYSETGALLQQIDPPDGFSVTAAAWAPDGERFVYLVSPTGVGGN